MIRKTTRLELALDTAFSISASAVAIQKSAKLSDFDFIPEPGMLYVATRAISSRVNANYDGWPPEEIRRAYKSFIGRGVFVDHNNWDAERSRGVILDATLHETKLASGHEDVWVELLIEVDAQQFPRLAKAILAGDIDAVSMGADVEYTICSVCDNKAHDVMQYCSHIPSMKGRQIETIDPRSKQGRRIKKLCYEDCYGVNFFEISFVFDPADESALISDSMLYDGPRVAGRVRRVAETVDQYKTRLRRTASVWMPDAQELEVLSRDINAALASDLRLAVFHRGDKVVMSLPDDVDTLRDELECPQCSAEWDGMICDNCGFEIPPEGLADPNTDPMGIQMPMGPPTGEEGEEGEEGAEADPAAGQVMPGQTPPGDDTRQPQDGEDQGDEDAEAPDDSGDKKAPPKSKDSDSDSDEDSKSKPKSKDKGDKKKSPSKKGDPKDSDEDDDSDDDSGGSSGEVTKDVDRAEKDLDAGDTDKTKKDLEQVKKDLKKKKKTGGERVSRFAEVAGTELPNREATLPQEPPYRQDTSPAQSVPPYGQAIPGGTPTPAPQPLLEAPAPNLVNVQDLDSEDVVGPPGQSTVTDVGDDGQAIPPGSAAGQQVNKAGSAEIEEERFAKERQASFLRRRADLLQRQAEFFLKRAEEVFPADVQNLDEPAPVNVGPDAVTDVMAPVQEQQQLALADTPDVINDGTEAAPPVEDRTKGQTNPFNDVSLVPYGQMGAGPDFGVSETLTGRGASKNDGEPAGETEVVRREAFLRDRAEKQLAAQKAREGQRIAAAKTRVLRISNFVDERIELGLTDPSEKFAEINRFEDMDDATLDGFVQATAEFKRAHVRTASQRIRVSASQEVPEKMDRVPSRMPSMTSAFRPEAMADGMETEDYFLGIS